MTDRPIIFSGPMVRALLDGSKTQTRRILQPQLVCHSHADWPDSRAPKPVVDEDGLHCAICGAGVSLSHRTKSGVKGIPVRYAVGDRLWVRENWALHGRFKDVGRVAYMASINQRWTEAHEDIPVGLVPANIKARPFQDGWKPSIHMPRPFSRLTLIVTEVRVQRLQQITEEDAIEEGANRHVCFRDIWNALNGERKDGIYAWDANPWVVAVSFTVERRNIDRR